MPGAQQSGAETGALLAEEFAVLAERLRRSTVQVWAGRMSVGSGVIWRADGLIVTNAHVARDRRSEVVLAAGRSLPAGMIATDSQRDLAALKVEAGGLEAAPVRDSDSLRAGELVFAVGNPLGLVGAVSTGIIHAVDPTSGPRERTWVQADVRLAPGNSGGPLADVRGRVVGINSMVAGGLALAVLSNVVTRFLSDLEERPYLGVSAQPVGVALEGRRILGLLVIEVESLSAGEEAGLRIGDVLIASGDKPFDEPADLSRALRMAGFGNTLRLDFLRAGKRMTCDVRLHGPRKGARAA